MDQGFIKLNRRILEWEWYGDLKTYKVFTHLLLRVNWEEKNWRGVKVLPGQLITSYSHLAKEIGISVRSTRTVLDKLKSTGELTIETTNRYSIISIIKWGDYQFKEEIQTSKKSVKESIKRQTNDKQTTTTKEDKELKESKEEKNVTISNGQAVAEIPELFKVFESKNPAIKRMYGIPAQRKSAENLIKQFGLEKCLKAAEAAVACLGRAYAPRITTPYMLETKWGELVAFYQENKEKNNEATIKVHQIK